ncbi:three-helix bundle dimerization domain-containing protein [Streptomyces sp. NPDC056242]|uniref:three-helix bundle dimerization domain-containing protein n=1 Tax=Streptomyces sp. NPDC056242 TaxID=3345760 RepID=UPI0035E3051B
MARETPSSPSSPGSTVGLRGLPAPGFGRRSCPSEPRMSGSTHSRGAWAGGHRHGTCGVPERSTGPGPSGASARSCPGAAAMTVDERMPPVGGAQAPLEAGSLSSPPVEQAEPEVPPDPPPAVPPAEDLAVRDMVGRLREAWPTVAENVVETAVRSAYDSFRQARVRAYVPILVERRARRALGAVAGGHVARSEERRPGEELMGDVGRESRADRGVHRAAEGGAGVEGPPEPGLRPS